MAMICLPDLDSDTSNFSDGNLGAPVDPETGRLGPARFKDPATIMNEHSRHPASDESIDDFVLPMWRDAVDLALEAHARLNDAPFVGWDVAISENGPLLIEGNQGFGSESPQLAHLAPMGATGYPEAYALHIRAFQG